jgi:NADH-quinone oxidoreductase subunit M
MDNIFRIITFYSFVLFLIYLLYCYFFVGSVKSKWYQYIDINIIKKWNFFFFSILLLLLIIIQFICFFLWINFDPFLIVTKFNRGFQYFYLYSTNSFLNFNITFGLDGFSLIFIILTSFIFILCTFILIADEDFTNTKLLLVITLIILELLLFLIFLVLDLFFFYICFESSLIPMFFIVGYWGSRARRIKASFYLFLYTMSTALLTLLAILYITLQVGSTFYPDLLNYNFSQNEQLIIWCLLFFTFATKIPIIPFHIWLPEAHVEAPTIGSVILASILLKLGGYGFYRYLLPLFPYATTFYLPFVYTLGICSILYASLTTIRQIDLKRIIAYSSIAHMNMCILGIFSNNWQGIDGATFLMIGHGVISTALFFLVGVIYERYHTRLLRYYGGLITVMPLFGSFFLLFILGNIGFPGTSNFVGEILILIGIFENNPFIAVCTGSGIILSAVYSMWLFNRLFFGTFNFNMGNIFIDLTRNESLIFIPLIFLMVFLGLNSDTIFNITILNVEHLLIYILQK